LPPREHCSEEARVSDHDEINRPLHYQGKGGMQAIDVIEAFELNYRLGNAIKYILRAGKKGDASTCLQKARWYLDREIAKRESAALVVLAGEQEQP
jgi:hypothetical protein